MKKIFLLTAVLHISPFFAFATGNTIYDGQDISGKTFGSESFSNSSFVGSNLSKSIFERCSFTNANLTNANLKDAQFKNGGNFTNAILKGADLTGVYMSWVTLDGADFTDVIITNASITNSPFTKEQLMSTKNYKDKEICSVSFYSRDNKVFNGASIDFTDFNLTGTAFEYVVLNNSNFTNSNLRNASFGYSTITDSKFINADLTNAYLRYTSLINADFSGANIKDAIFSATTITGSNFYNSNLTQDQLKNTYDWANKNLSGMNLGKVDLSGLDFTGFNLSEFFFTDSSLSNFNFENVNLQSSNLSGSDFTSSSFINTNLTNVNFSNSILNGVSFKNSDIKDSLIIGADLSNTVSNGFTDAMFYSTKSYVDGDLIGIMFDYNNISNWILTGKNLQNTSFFATRINGVDFSNSDLRGAEITATAGTATYKNTIMSDGIIKNISLTSSYDVLRIRKYMPTTVGGDMISAKLNTSATMSNGSSIILENGADFRITNNAVLTVGEGSKINLSTSMQDLTSFVVEAGSSLLFDANSILNVNIDAGEDFNHTLTFNIIEWEDTAIVEGLSNLKKNENFTLTLNGETYTGAWDYVQDTNSLKVILVVPEPSTYAAIFGALAFAFVAYRKRK